MPKLHLKFSPPLATLVIAGALIPISLWLDSRQNNSDVSESPNILRSTTHNDAIPTGNPTFSLHEPSGCGPSCQHCSAKAPEVDPKVLATFNLDLPDTLPENFSITVPLNEETVNLRLRKHSVRGEHTQYIVPDGSGGLLSLPLPEVRSYLGEIEGKPEIYVAGHLTKDGLALNLHEDYGDTWQITPGEKYGEHQLAQITTTTDGRSESSGIPSCSPLDDLSRDIQTMTQGFAPIPNIQGRQAILAVDLDWPFARKHLGLPDLGLNEAPSAAVRSAVEASALQRAESLIMNSLNPRFVRSYAVLWTVGPIVVRDIEGSDPYVGTEGSARFNVARNMWNGANPPVPAGTPRNWDTVVTGHGNGLGGGFAGLAASNIAANNGSTIGGWENVTLHEVHHNWGHPHGIGRGSDLTPWGKWISTSMINGADTRKANFDGHTTTMNNRAGRGSSLEAINITTPAAPYLEWDTYSSVQVGAGNSVLIDVLFNDHDANNDQVRILDKFSSHSSTFVSNGFNLAGVSPNSVVFSNTTHRGGRVELVPGTNGQRDQVRYFPPASTTATFDAFHYYVVDNSGPNGTDGLEDFGMVKVGLLQPTIVNESSTLYRYDVGPASQHVNSGPPLSPETYGDVFWTGGLSTADRFIDNDGSLISVNRDMIISSSPATLHHKLANGTWRVSMVMGDKDARRNEMNVSAEGELKLFRVNSAANTYSLQTFVVEVTDGELTLDFSSNLGLPWVLNYLEIENASTSVDLTRSSYDYDVGTDSSPVEPGFEAITPSVTGDISLTNGVINQLDRGPVANGIPAYNRDFIYSNALTLNHKISNGLWAVTATFGDRTFAHDRMQFSAENGQVTSEEVTTAVGEFKSATILAEVTDGELNLRFEDNGGSDGNFVLTRISLEKVNLDASVYRYDLGTATTPVVAGYTRLTNESSGQATLSGGTIITGDRSGAGDDLKRDFIYSSQAISLDHLVSNGFWRVTVGWGEFTYNHDQMQVSAEDGAVVSDVINAPPQTYPETVLEVEVTDGVLNLVFDDLGGSDINWVVNSLVLESIIDPDLVVQTLNYDFGTATSDVSSGFTRISPSTSGSINFTGPGNLRALDRGAIAGEPDYNQDFLFSFEGDLTFNHPAEDGPWDVTVTFGDRTLLHDDMQVSAEDDQFVSAGVDTAPGDFGSSSPLHDRFS